MLKLTIDQKNIATLTIEMAKKPVNVVDDDFVDQFQQQVLSIVANEKIVGLIITSGRDEFIVGADLKMLQNIYILIQK